MLSWTWTHRENADKQMYWYEREPKRVPIRVDERLASGCRPDYTVRLLEATFRLKRTLSARNGFGSYEHKLGLIDMSLS